MGNDRSMKFSKSEKKKKRRGKGNELELSHKKNIYYSDDEESDNQFKAKESKKKSIKLSTIMEEDSLKKKSKHEKSSDFEETPKKKTKQIDDYYESAKKKSKKDKGYDADFDVYEDKRKSKKGRDIVSSKKRLSDLSPSKLKKNSILYHDSHSDFDHSDSEDLKSDLKENMGEPMIMTSERLIEEETGWHKEDFVTLLDSMNKLIPDNDHLKYSSRAEKLDWNQIRFDNHTAEECKEKWKLVEKKVRGFRILREMVDDAKLWLDRPWSSFYNSHKKNRHPDMPRRPLTSYMLYYMAKKNKYAKKHPELGLTNLSKIIADQFHRLSHSKKMKYIDKAKALREEFHAKMRKFLDTHPDENLAKRRQNEGRMEMPGPKRPLPPFKLFLEEKLKHFNENDGQTKAEFVSQSKRAWKNLSSKKKVHWIRWAHENEKKYLEELETYRSENPNFLMPKIKPLLSKEEFTILERMDGKPEKPPNSAYSLFSRLMLKDDQIKVMNYSPKERMRAISRLWAAVTDEEKKRYQEKAKQLCETYKLEYATYLESLPEDKRAEELAKSQSRKRKIKDGVKETNDKGKKLKQTKIVEAFRNKNEEKKEVIKSESSEEESEPEVVGNVFNNPKKLKEIQSKIEALDPPKPSLGAFELFKEIYLTNPGNKESKAKMVWESMPTKEKDRYRKKLEVQKQNYIGKYKEFLAKLKPHEIKVYSMMKNQSSPNLSESSSEEEESNDEDEDSSDEDNHYQVVRQGPVADANTDDSSSSSEESD